MSRNDDLAPIDLDPRPGPALPLSREDEDRIVGSVLDAHFAAQAAPRRPWLPILAAAAVLLAVSGAMAAWMATPDPVPPRPRPPPASAPVIAAPDPPPEVAPPSPPIPPGPPSRPTRPRHAKPKAAEDLLAKANALRARSRWRRAESVYVEVAERFPGSGSAYVALVAAGALRLEHLDDARRALQLLARAARLRENGPLDAEIVWNESRAHRRLHHDEAERASLQRLLSRHPSAPFSEEAQARLRALGGDR